MTFNNILCLVGAALLVGWCTSVNAAPQCGPLTSGHNWLKTKHGEEPLMSLVAGDTALVIYTSPTKEGEAKTWTLTQVDRNTNTICFLGSGTGVFVFPQGEPA